VVSGIEFCFRRRVNPRRATFFSFHDSAYRGRGLRQVLLDDSDIKTTHETTLNSVIVGADGCSTETSVVLIKSRVDGSQGAG